MWDLDHLSARGLKLFKFLAAGLPSFLVAVPLNWLLVVKAGWYEPLAYALVLFVQVSVNFFVCRRFVFVELNDKHVFLQFGQFLSGIMLFRLADWALYSFVVHVCGFYFLAVQVANVFIFAVLKFKFSEKVLEH